jgi:hypothetical protein
MSSYFRAARHPSFFRLQPELDQGGFGRRKGGDVMATNRNPTGFLTAVARIHLSHLFQDPFLRAAFRAAEDEGLAPGLIQTDRPRTLNGGAAEPVLAMAEG